MADARSMLRASREARKIKHPHASYTKDGKLLCNLCETTIKTDSAWQGHLHATQHTLRLSRAQDAAAARSVGEETGSSASKKRKASTIDSPSPEDRKKSKPVTFTPGVEEMDDEEPGSVQHVNHDTQAQAHEKRMAPQADEQGADPAELEAFERELAEMERSMRDGATSNQGAVISAAPISAEEIAAQAREEQSIQRGRRDAELEAEKEDAARLLEDEFEEMEGLEERARKLREKREALRTAAASDPQATNATHVTVRSKDSPSSASHVRDVNGDEAEDEDDEDDDENEDYDEWNFGNS